MIAIASLRALRLFEVLAVLVGLLAVGSFNNRVEDFDRFPSNAQPRGSAPAAVLLPVQFRDPTGLGLGKVLVASRDLDDPRFAETVILLVRYDAQGAVGLVLNRRTKFQISQVLNDLKGAKGCSDPVYLGGPLEPRLTFGLFQSTAKIEGAENVFGGVYLITAKTIFEQTLSTRPNAGFFRAYLGYAG